MITEILSNALMGTLSGYTTDSLAIDSIFGGDALKGSYASEIKTSLADSIGTLIENEAINPEKIKHALLNSGTSSPFDKLSAMFRGPSLHKSLDRMNTIPSCDKLKEKLQDFVIKFIDENSDSIIDGLIKNADSRILLTDGQVNKIADSILDIVYDVVSDTALWQSIFDTLSVGLSSVKLSDIVPKQLTEQIIENIGELLGNASDILRQSYSEETDRILEAIASDLDIESIFRTIYSDTLKQPISFMLPVNTYEISKKVAPSVTKFLASEKCHTIISDAYDDTLSYIKSMGLTLQDMLPEGHEEKLHTALSQAWPNMAAETMLKWLTDIRDQIEASVNKSIDAVITEKSIKDRSKLSEAVSHLLDDQLDSSSGLMRFLIMIASQVGDRNISGMASADISLYLSSITVKGMIEDLEDKGILSKSSAIAYILDFMGKEASTAVKYILDSLASMPVGNFMPDGAFDIIYARIKYFFYDYIKESILFSKNEQEQTIKALKKRLDALTSKSLTEIINILYPQDTAFNAGSQLSSIIKNNYDSFKDLIKSMLEPDRLTEQFQHAIKSNSEIVEKYVKGMYSDTLFSEISETPRHLLLSDIITAASQHEGLANIITEVVGDVTCLNMSTITDGIIKKSVSANIENMGGNEFLNFTLNLTERNLKKSILTGSVFGAAFGTILPIIQSKTGFNLHPIIQCCIIGYITDLMCIKTIFKPSGVSSENSSFASRLAHTITPKLLNEDVARISIEINRPHIKSKLLEQLSYDKLLNPDMISSISVCFSDIIHSCFKHVTSNTVLLRSDSVLRDIAGYPIKNILVPENTQAIAEYASAYFVKHICSVIESYITDTQNASFDRLSSDAEKILRLISLSASDDYKEKLNRICDFSEFKKHLNQYSESYEKANSQPLSEFTIYYGIYDKLEEKIHNGLCTYVSDDKFMIPAAEAIYSAVTELCPPDTKIRKTMNARSMLRLNTEAYKYFTDYIAAIDSYIYQNRLEISDNLFDLLYNYPEIQKTKLTVEDIDILLMHILMNSIDTLIKSNTDRFFTLSRSMMDNFLYDRTLEETGAYPVKQCVREILKRFSDEEDAPIFRNKLYFLTNSFVSRLSSIQTSTLTNILGLESVSKVASICTSTGTPLLQSIKIKLENNQSIVMPHIDMLMNYALPEQKSNLVMQPIYKCLTTEISQKLCSNIRKAEMSKKAICTTLNQALTLWASTLDDSDGIYRLTDFAQLASSITELTEIWESSPHFNLLLKAFSEHTAAQVIKGNLIPAKTKLYFKDKLSDTYIDALSSCIYDILSKIDFEKIIEKSIHSVEPKKINKAFGRAVNKNILKMSVHGLSGGVFGINYGLSSAITATYAIWKTIDRKQKNLQYTLKQK